MFSAPDARLRTVKHPCFLSLQNFAQENKPGNVGSFSLTKGVNKFCLAQPGVYKLTLDSCHQFEQDIYRYDT